MKRLFILLLIFPIISCALLATQFSTSNDFLRFDLVPETPLFQTIKMDTFSASTNFNYITISDVENIPYQIRVVDKNNIKTTKQYRDIPFAKKESNSYLHMKLGVTQGLFRLGVGPVSAELVLQGGLNTVFQLSGGSMALGFDGLYMLGFNASLYDIVDFTCGLHHFSGHIGDELLSSATSKSGEAFDTNWEALEYVRDNSLSLGISVTPVESLRFYLSANKPLQTSWIRPLVHIPESTSSPSTSKPLQDHVDGQESIEGYHSIMNYAENYKAWIIQTGIETSYHIDNFGNISLSGGVKMHQDGQTKHQLGQYDENNPWELEYNVGLGIELEKSNSEGNLSINVTYHDGRFPLLNMFYNRSKYLSVGFSVI